MWGLFWKLWRNKNRLGGYLYFIKIFWQPLVGETRQVWTSLKPSVWWFGLIKIWVLRILLIKSVRNDKKWVTVFDANNTNSPWLQKHLKVWRKEIMICLSWVFEKLAYKCVFWYYITFFITYKKQPCYHFQLPLKSFGLGLFG